MNWLRRHDVAVFLFLSFALSWWPWPFALMNPASTAIMIPWAPIFAAFIVLVLTQGREGVKGLLKAMGRWRVGIQWYAVALLFPFAVALAAVFLNGALGGPTPSLALLADPLLPVSFIALMLINGPFTEEPGWRGFLLPRLMTSRSPLAASLIVGVIWAAWHLPLLISEPTRQRPPVQYLIALLAMSLVLAWLYKATRGSVLLPIFMHTAINFFPSLLFPSQMGVFYGRLWWLYAALWCLLAVAIIRTPFFNRERVLQPAEAPAP